MSGENKGDFLPAAVAPDQGSLVIPKVFFYCNRLSVFTSFRFFGGSQVDQGSGTIHRRFIGTIIAVVVMVYGQPALEFRVFIGVF